MKDFSAEPYIDRDRKIGPRSPVPGDAATFDSFARDYARLPEELVARGFSRAGLASEDLTPEFYTEQFFRMLHHLTSAGAYRDLPFRYEALFHAFDSSVPAPGLADGIKSMASSSSPTEYWLGTAINVLADYVAYRESLGGKEFSKAEHLPNIDDHRVRYFSVTGRNQNDVRALATRLCTQLRESFDDPSAPADQRFSDRTEDRWVEGVTLSLGKVRTAGDFDEETARIFLQTLLQSMQFADKNDEFEFLGKLAQPKQFHRFLPGMQLALIRELIENPVVQEEDRKHAKEDLAGIENSRPRFGDEHLQVTLQPWVANIRNGRIILAANLVSIEHARHPFAGTQPPMIHAATVRNGSEARRVLSNVRRKSHDDEALSEFALVGKHALPEDVAAFADRISQLGGNSYIAGGERTLRLVGNFHNPAHRTTFIPSKLDQPISIDMGKSRQSPTQPPSPGGGLRKFLKRN